MLGGQVSANGGNQLRNGRKIKSVVFDLGGVLFSEGKSVALEVLSRDYGYDPAVVREVLTCPRSREMRKGLIAEDAFWSWVEDQTPRDYDAKAIRDEWYKGYALDQDVFELAKRLKGDFRLAAFSENVRDRVAYLDEKYSFRELFDVEIYSYDHHVGKRDPRFLDILLTTLGGRPDEILYIDDSRKVLELAEQRGVNVVHYTTGQKTRIEAAMRQLGVLA